MIPCYIGAMTSLVTHISLASLPHPRSERLESALYESASTLARGARAAERRGLDPELRRATLCALCAHAGARLQAVVRDLERELSRR